MRIGLLLSALVLVVAGCSEPEDAELNEDESIPGLTIPTSEDSVVATDIEVTIGDVEQQVRLNGTVEEPDRPLEGVKVEEIEDPRGKMNLVTVDISPPYPQSLMLTYRLSAQRNFPDTPVVLRGRILTDKTAEPLATFTEVLGEQATRVDRAVKVDLMAALTEIPDTLLVTADLDALLLAKGTPEESVDPATAETTPDRQSKILVNPIRVNFLKEGEAPPPPETLPVPSSIVPVTPGEETPAAPTPAPEATAPEAAPASDAAPAGPEASSESASPGAETSEAAPAPDTAPAPEEAAPAAEAPAEPDAAAQ
jgi:hypothetical protein